jgi:hypothetical protein
MTEASKSAAPADELDFIAHLADGLNFEDSEDRVIFRERVAFGTRALKVSAIKEVVSSATQSRAAATRALADAFIARVGSAA